MILKFYFSLFLKELLITAKKYKNAISYFGRKIEYNKIRNFVMHRKIKGL